MFLRGPPAPPLPCLAATRRHGRAGGGGGGGGGGVRIPFVANVTSYLVFSYIFTNTTKPVLHLSYLVRLD